MKLRLLLEGWIKDAIAKKRGRPKSFPIFKNPDTKEIGEAIGHKNMLGNIRVIIDTKKNDFYVFDAELLHKDAAKALGFIYDFLKNNTGQFFVVGDYRPKKRKIVLGTDEFKDKADITALRKLDFFNKYFEVDDK